jgi:protein arginine kinase activator
MNNSAMMISRPDAPIMVDKRSICGYIYLVYERLNLFHLTMLCDNCKKNESTIRYTEIRNGGSLTRNLCDDCARSAGLADPLEKTILSLGSAVTEAIKTFIEREREPARLACPACGLTAAEFRRTGRLGCPACGTVFAGMIAPVLRRLHCAGPAAADQAVTAGPPPGEAPDGTRHGLEQRMARAVEREEYELAAVLRDQLRDLGARSACRAADAGDGTCDQPRDDER